MVTEPRISVPPEKLAEFCRRNHIKRLGLFGSVLRDDFRPDSDVDVLYEFEEGQTPGFDFVRIYDELSALFEGRKLDMVAFDYINHRLRDRILAEARVIYDAT